MVNSNVTAPLACVARKRPSPTPSEPSVEPEENRSSEQMTNMDFTVEPLVMGVWGEVNLSVHKVLDDAAEAGLDQYFSTVVTTSHKVARAQLRALMARRFA